ncbi:hypothetical protein FHS39_000868 [Streptomyces olivoverticillatus]|uniref:Uncharacterized protein n=1 Tax=Streptomyces olivoverticillatus TaxID=66427 RepID=A0A7W7LLH4_9ACTN|nr:hypothetical protein [Streptomyces olivoverticillatus]MBB4891868.1 hypothetical protein [Streptomyces olivoverticillatus]
MALEKLASDCKEGPCPTLWRTEHGRYIVQGFKVLSAERLAQLDLPENETAVEVMAELLEGYFNSPRG